MKVHMIYKYTHIVIYQDAMIMSHVSATTYQNMSQRKYRWMMHHYWEAKNVRIEVCECMFGI